MMILKIDPNEVRWFAMSSPYCREMKAKELLDSHGIKNFIPMVRKQVVVDDELETKETPYHLYIASVIFSNHRHFTRNSPIKRTHLELLSQKHYRF